MTTNVQTQIRRTAVPDQLNSLVGRMAAEYGVDKAKLYSTLANSIFAQGGKDRKTAAVSWKSGKGGKIPENS